MNSSERRLNAIVNNSTAAIFLMDERQHCVFMNKAAEALTGYRLEEAVDRPLHDVVHHQRPDGTPYPLAECPIDQAFPERERMTGEEMFVHKDGHFYPVAFTASPVAGDDGQPVGTIIEVRDLTEEKAREAALRESEGRFRNMADHAPVMMWVTDATGYCTYLNHQWYQFTGQTVEQASGYGWLEATHPDDRQRTEDAFVAANADHTSFRFEYRLRHASSAYRWAIDAASPRFADDGEFLGYVGSVIDIDERRSAEERLAVSEEQLRLALEVAEIGQWDVDQATGSMFWPPRVKAMFGISADVPVTLDDFHAGVHPEDRDKTREAYESASDPELRALYDVEYRTVGKEDGAIRWVAAKGRGLFDAQGHCSRVIGTAIDVTARKAAEIRLHQLNERLEHEVTAHTAERNRVWEMSRDLLAIMGFDGFLKAINPAWEATLGRDAETLMALSFREQVHPDDHDAARDVMERLLRGETVERFEERIAHADGSWRWISWTLVPEGDVFYAVGRDVTPEKAAAEELENAQEALRQSQKMEAMGQLTGGVAHDFNNLLTPILGALDMLQRRGVGGDREQRLIEGALQSADRAATLVQRLLAFARRQPLQSAAVDVGKLVEGMADLLASTTGPQVEVVVEVAADLPPAKADPNQLEMALLNLGVNARDAMPRGGTLRITATRDSVRTPRGALKRGHYVRLSVADTGVGMDPATLARAIEPFFSTKGIGKGTGLGLSMAHGLAAQLGGALIIHSREGVGTNIELWLPVSAVSPDGAAQSSDLALVEPGRGLALLVDDEDVVRSITADMLEEFGYEVREANSAEAALALVTAGLSPDLLVSDHLMPGMSGVELALELRKSKPDLPVLIVSGYADVEGLTPGLPRLVKPFRSTELAASLSAL
ncbi:PAS domain S-box protein [Microvirga sp. SRT01]|uniref:histidine kinase n=1 Tax=Sphingomonas longa TaxID=2778730 RepID=A0ABS2D9P3_9SPHN|nr:MULTISPECIES: PAS domain S-box protein [Alphaproteobacteria]MBM6577659.1 PAS domain S-box protein [Sphingomonas sp. BT552]MBR7710702.1 PAS domain S-box protein [Microvirga sp. SRT01]